MDYKWLLLSPKGRLNRQPFWYTNIAFYLTALFVGYIDTMIFGGATALVEGGDTSPFQNTPLTSILSLLFLWPSLMIILKRFHDRDMSAWYLLWLFVPLVNLIMIIWVGCKKGTIGENKFGSDPLADQNGEKRGVETSVTP